MRHPRRLSTIALASLLIGNLAGWVHVGQHAGGVCCDLSQPTSVVSDDRRCCAAHRCDGDQLPDSGPAHQTETERFSEPDQPVPHPSHDGENCTVCEYFESTRDGWTWIATGSAFETETKCDGTIITDQDDRSSEPRSAYFLRGPPQV